MKFSLLKIIATASITLAAFSSPTLANDQSAEVEDFARSAYKSLYQTTWKEIDSNIAAAAPLFSSEAGHASHRSSYADNHATIIRNELSTKVITDLASTTAKSDNTWQVKFPAEISYNGKTRSRQCLDVTMNITKQGSDYKIMNAISEDGNCIDNRAE